MKNRESASDNNTSAVILCGGNASRLNHQNKGLVDWRGKPLIEHAIESLPPNYPRLISANQNIEQYSQYGTVVADTDTGLPSKSPLIGVLSALNKMKTDWLLCLPVDTPMLKRGWHQPLMSQSPDHSLVFARDPDRGQPIHVLLHRSEYDPLNNYLNAGNKSANNFLETREAAAVMFSDAGQFKNFNTPEDFV